MQLKVKEHLKTIRQEVCSTIPAFDAILYAATYRESKEIQTLAINNARLEILVNPEYLLARSKKDGAFILAHEAAHFLCDHSRRAEAMRAREGEHFRIDLWQEACEHAVNAVVESLSGWKTPGGGVAPVDKWRALDTENIYHELRKDPNRKRRVVRCKCGEGDGPEGQTVKADAIAMVGEQTRDTAEQTLQSPTSGLQPGTEIGELKALLLRNQKLARPPDWRKQLARFLTALDTDCKVFDLRSVYRRALCDGRNMVLPNLASEAVARRFALSLDNSGSVDDGMFSQILGVVHSVTQQLGFKELLVYHFTSTIVKRLKLTTANQVKKINRVASGGTDIQEVDRQAKLDSCMFNVIVTDGYVDWLPSYGVPTLVVLTVKDGSSPTPVHNLLGVVYAT